MFSQDRLYAELTRRLRDASPDGCPDLPPTAVGRSGFDIR